MEHPDAQPNRQNTGGVRVSPFAQLSDCEPVEQVRNQSLIAHALLGRAFLNRLSLTRDTDIVPDDPRGPREARMFRRRRVSLTAIRLASIDSSISSPCLSGAFFAFRSVVTVLS